MNGEMKVNELGLIAREQWISIAGRFQNTTFGEFVVMPNHMHGIIIINEPNVGAGLTPAQNVSLNSANNENQNFVLNSAISQNENNLQFGVPVTLRCAPVHGGTPTIGEIVGAYKSLVFRDCLSLYKKQDKYLGKLWQRNYFEHIIRNEAAYQKIMEYILINPLKWEEDKYYHK